MNMKPWPKRTPRLDDRLVGITFVDVLFALVIAKVLEPFSSVGDIPAAGIAQLILAAVLTLSSWIGYHNSWNRPKYFIVFPNLPLLQFVIDVLLVVAYWLTAVYAEGTVRPLCATILHTNCDTVSALPETSLVAICFLLYIAWDVVGWRMRENDRYTDRQREDDVPSRRKVTQWCFFTCVLVWICVFSVSPHETVEVIAVDGALLAIILAFRFLKEYVTPEGAYRAVAQP